jgi:uncharacterized lipoprotein YddW (UPF0748 family)
MHTPWYPVFTRALKATLVSVAALAAWAGHAAAQAPESAPKLAPAEVRGTWVTTTANTAIASPANTAETMTKLRAIGLNTVYVETWKNGYTQYPSEALKKVIGVDRRPNLMPQDPSDTPEQLKKPARDLLDETLIEAHRNQLIYIGWFEFGFMAAHSSTQNHLRKMKPEWMSRDIKGNEVAKNGFVWMNPLHPETRRFLLDIVLEAVDKYDLDGVQLDDRIVWPYFDMGYDDYTKKAYAAEHNGKEPPADPKDPEWTRWRIEKVNEYSKMFVQEIRAKRPGLMISLSPAVYPWCLEYYLLEWPKWAAWTSADALHPPSAGLSKDWPGANQTPRWDEYIPQCYRFSYDAYEKTWLDQVKYMNELGAGRVKDLIAGIRLVGEGKDSTWDDLRKSVELVRKTGGGGHVHWFSRGVLDVFPNELTTFYDVVGKGRSPHPVFGADWRPAPIRMIKKDGVWNAEVPTGAYRVIAKKNGVWRTIGAHTATKSDGPGLLPVPAVRDDGYEAVELLVDRREALGKPRRP